MGGEWWGVEVRVKRSSGSNPQANEIKNKVKCTNQAYGPLLSEPLKKNSFLKGSQEYPKVCRGSSIWSLDMWISKQNLTTASASNILAGVGGGAFAL